MQYIEIKKKSVNTETMQLQKKAKFKIGIIKLAVAFWVLKSHKKIILTKGWMFPIRIVSKAYQI